MARRSQTELAVLGALSTGPMSGYEVRAAIAGSIGHFWHESFGQIYPALGTLEEAGAVRRRSAGRTSGSVFELTAGGADRLRALLAEPHAPVRARNGLLLRLFFGRHLPAGAAGQLLAEAEAGAAAALAEYGTIRAGLPEDPGPEQRYRTMTLSFGEHMARAQLEWARECLAELPSIEAAEGGGAGARG